MPSAKWTDEQIEEMLQRMARGEAIAHIEREDGMPSADSMERWEAAGDELAGRITRARERGYDYLAAQMRIEAREAKDAGLGRLKFDADRWYLSKLLPRKYGEKIAHVGGGSDDPAIKHAVDLSNLTDEQRRAVASIKLPGEA